MHNEQEYGENNITSHEISDRDKGLKSYLLNIYAKDSVDLFLDIVFYWLCAKLIPITCMTTPTM